MGNEFKEEEYEEDFVLLSEEEIVKKDSLKPETIFEERVMSTVSFKEFPNTIRNKILYQLAITIAINILIILVMIIFAFKIEILLILIVLDFILIGNIKYIYDKISYIDCIVFKGYVINIDLKGIIGTNSRYKRITMCDDAADKILSFDYYGKGKIGEGYPVTLYIAKDEEVKIKEDIPYVSNILAVSFSEEMFKNNDDNSEKINIENYLEK